MLIIKYWFHILETNENKYINQTYNILINDIDNLPTTTNWASLVKTLLRNHGFYHVWINQGVGHIEAFLNIFKQRLTDNSVQSWHARINESSRALFYKNGCDFKLQYYLKDITVTKFRVAFARFKVSSHRLEIEAGRWNRTPIDNRRCSLCACLEDEYHFILECTMYTDIRKTYIRSYFYRRPNMVKFIQLIQSENSSIVRNLGVYIFKAFQIRNENLYNAN